MGTVKRRRAPEETRNTRGRRLLAVAMQRRGVSKRAFGKAIGVSHQSVTAWLEGNARPVEAYRVAIETWTGGAVPAASWLARCDRAELKAARAPFVPQAGTG